MVNGQNGYLVLKFRGQIKGQPFDHGKFVFWPWSWSKCSFFGLISCQNLRLTISTTKNLDFGHGHGRNFDHMTIVISKFWPWSWSKIFDHMTMTPARRPYGQKIMVALPPPNQPIFVKYQIISRKKNEPVVNVVEVCSFRLRSGVRKTHCS